MMNGGNMPNATKMNDNDHDLPPLVRALKASAKRKTACFHFPGHKRGQSEPSTMIGSDPFLHDVTELPDLDNFFLAAELFGAKETWFLVGGTSCGVQAAILATCSPGETIILMRNTCIDHYRDSICRGRAKVYLGAVFLTSPTYNGICSNLNEISKLCHSNGIPLIVHEAHGAHFKFHPKMPKTALDQGADIVIQSTHKVLSSLSQSSMLHISNNDYQILIDRERLHKSSLDAARHQLSKISNTGLFDDAVMLADEAKVLINKIPGISIFSSSFTHDDEMDPLRITIGVWGLGLSGFHANKKVDDDFGIVPKLGMTREHVRMLMSGLRQLSNMFYSDEKELENSISRNVKFGEVVEMGLSPREAFFARVLIPQDIGVPVLVPGEVIGEGAVGYLQEIKNKGGFLIGAADPLLSTILVCKKKY
ncbi:hypothetical protein ACJIZ3_021581 [Penstemon smallii]|uniref:Orn/Lys/Arg decarboxylases family 1 pyridoxal-P attachment site domain-containing protein n=1 Tax=Penstemon smallii TaxID=265156 RepID=A0ABD3SM35_9LAMI